MGSRRLLGSSSRRFALDIPDCSRFQNLHAANIGDSGFLLLRGGEVIYQSQVQQHRFNCPYQPQLGKNNDSPVSAQELTVSVKLEDVIVAGSDGLFDNMHTSEIEELVKHGVEEDYTPQQLVWSLAWFAHSCSFDRLSSSPFEIAAQEARMEYMGGTCNDAFVQEVGASRGAFIDWDALTDDIRSFFNRQRNSGTCKYYYSLLQDCTEKYGSDSSYCAAYHRCTAKLSCNPEDAK
ncbi:probable protein phosphatase 2C 55 [Cornus florida]|uniref:probable protein phosphatase 2C 55 n=1 Tax=Cornus florida TaxID=4283 RepID=UPI0028A2CC50|nr:probable protein phosphatase 2C 55 [Cornus florida]